MDTQKQAPRERLDIRVNPGERETITLAAEREAIPPSTFVRSAALKAAREILSTDKTT